MGGTAAHSSGDIFFAFATGNRGLDARRASFRLRMLSDTEITPFYDAVIESTEEAILNAMLAAETMTGRDGNTVHALEPELLLEALPGKPEPASFERAGAHHATLVLGECVDRSPADVPAARAIGVGLPQRIRGELSVTTAAEALDYE